MALFYDKVCKFASKEGYCTCKKCRSFGRTCFGKVKDDPDDDVEPRPNDGYCKHHTKHNKEV